MSRKINIEPITRIEGHLKVETGVENNQVESAKVFGQMYRGFEQFLQNRHPLDAARIAQRVCGVCHEVHGIASCLALEELYGIEPPLNGKILRDLILGMHLITDHILHFYTLSLPDFADFTKILEYHGSNKEILKIKQWVKGNMPGFILNNQKGDFLNDNDATLRMVSNYFSAIKIRSIAGSGMAILGAKVPFAHAIMPGGITTDVTYEKMVTYHNALQKVKDFVLNSYLPDAQILTNNFKNYFNIGETYNNFYSNETFNLLGDPLFSSAIVSDSGRVNFDFNNVKENLDNSFYNSDGKPEENKSGAYSWVKSPRYNNKSLEVGPLARLIVANDDNFRHYLSETGIFYGNDLASLRSSTMARIVARAYESVRLIDHLEKLLDKYRIEEPTINDFDARQKITGSGIGLSIAARGELIHQIEARNGTISKYNMIVPSTWNFGPSDQNSLGTVEKALIGTPVKYSDSNSIEVGRVVRSFDPCTACSIH